MKIYLSKFLLPIASDPIENAALVIEGDRIRASGKAADLLSEFPQAEKIELGNAALLPGLVNAHAHLELEDLPSFFSSGDCDFSGQPNFIQWLISLSRFQDHRTAEDKRRSIQNRLETLRTSGVTTVGDWTTYDGALACYEKSGMRVVVFPEVLNLNRKLSQERFEVALGMIDEISEKDNPSLFSGLAPYAPYTLSKNLLKIFFQHVRQGPLPVQIHTSVSFAEMEFFYDSKGDIANLLFPHVGWQDQLPPPHQKTPIQYLSSIEFLQARPALVGCLHLGPTDLALIEKSGSSIVYCPRFQEIVQQGRMPIRRILSHKIPVGLGSEYALGPSNTTLWEEMRAAHEAHKQKEEPLTPREILRMATWGGAYNLGLEKQIGTLEKGKLADFIVVNHLENASLSTLEEDLVLRSSAESVREVVVGGVKK